MDGLGGSHLCKLDTDGPRNIDIYFKLLILPTIEHKDSLRFGISASTFLWGLVLFILYYILSRFELGNFFVNKPRCIQRDSLKRILGLYKLQTGKLFTCTLVSFSAKDIVPTKAVQQYRDPESLLHSLYDPYHK